MGPYELEGELGRGARGAVFRAVHRVLKRRCALKVIGAGADGAARGTVERFEREAQAAARLGRHPHVVQVFDVGAAGDALYIAMELVEGRDLGRIVAEDGPLPEERAAEIARKIALALDHAHSHGIIHRDVKPSNVILDGAGEPHLTDFGLALDTGLERLTAEGEILGTPATMAPEQTEGRRGRIGPRTDVYSLGATLYQMLSGGPPFEGSVAAVLAAVVLEDPPRLRERRPGVSAAVEAVVTKAMEKRPEERYRTALEFAGDLGRALAGEETRARPPGWLRSARRAARRHRAAVAVIAGLLLFALGAVAVAGGQAARARARREAAASRALEALGVASREAHIQALKEAVALEPDWPTIYLQLADRSSVQAVDRFRLGDFAGFEADLRLAIDAIAGAVSRGARASSLHQAGTFSEWIGDRAGATLAYRRATEADPDGYWGHAARAGAALIEGRFADAAEASTRAIEIDDADYAPFFRRSVARLALGDPDGALADAGAAVDRVPTDDWSRAQRARVWLARGEVRLAAFDLVAGLECLPYSPALYRVLAAVARREGEAGRAEALDARARALGRGAPPPYLACDGVPWAALAPHPAPAARHRGKAAALLAAGDDAGAIAEASIALGLSPADGEALRVRAGAFRAAGRIADADEDSRWAALLGPAP